MQSDIDVLAPKAGSKAVSCVVRQFNGFAQRAEGHGGEHRPEDLFLCDGGARMNIREQRWRIVQSLYRKLGSRLAAGCSLGYALIDQSPYALQLRRSNDGADINGLVERRAHAQRFHARANLRDQSLGDALLHEQTRACAANLSLIEPDAVHQPFDRAVQIGIIEDDERRLAAKLK